MLPTIAWQDGEVVMIDQRKLPGQEVYVHCKTAKDVAKAIKTMVIRGAPAIGVAAAMGVAIGVAPRKLELRIGPLRIGRAGAIVLDSTVDGLGPVIERLVDAYEVTVEGSSEFLALLVAAER